MWTCSSASSSVFFEVSFWTVSSASAAASCSCKNRINEN